MAQNYTRQSSFTDGDTITADLFNNEYNQLVNAFAYSGIDANATGHTHDGSLGQGGNISKIGDIDFLNKIEIDGTNNRMGFFVEVGGVTTEQVRISDGLIVPVTTNDIDLGSASLQFKDGYFDGTVNADSLVADTADINGGTLDAVTIGATTAGEITGTTITYGSLSDGTITITAFVDEDDMISNSATLVPTQQSVKAYVDAQVTAQDLDFQGDTGGALSIDLDSETLTIAGGTGIDTVGATNTLTVSIDSTVATLTGTQTLTNKTINADNNTVSNLEVDNLKTGVLDTDISSVAVTHTTLPSALAVKTYVDAQVTAQDLDIVGDTGTDAIDLDSETITFAGGTGLTSTVTTGTVTFDIDSTVATLTGAQTLTNKTISASSNTISNLTVTSLAAGVLDTDLASVSSLHDTIPSAKAVYDYVAVLAGTANPVFTGTVTADNLTVNGNTILGSDAADTLTVNANSTFAGTTIASLGTVTTADINGGTIDGVVIGGSSAAAGSFTNITVSGTVDGRDVAADGTKLDGIEAGATADQTAAEIRTLVEAATDSNVFTDADHSKLDGIEALADVTDTANVTAAGALMDSELTNITAVKALNQGVATTDSPSFAGITATTADINGGTVDGTVVGGTTPAAGTFTTNTSDVFISSTTTTTSTSKTLANGEQCVVDTATQTLTLPASPSAGDNVSVFVGDFTDTVVARNGSNIMGLAEDLIIDSANIGIKLVYIDASNGWRILV